MIVCGNNKFLKQFCMKSWDKMCEWNKCHGFGLKRSSLESYFGINALRVINQMNYGDSKQIKMMNRLQRWPDRQDRTDMIVKPVSDLMDESDVHSCNELIIVLCSPRRPKSSTPRAAKMKKSRKNRRPKFPT